MRIVSYNILDGGIGRADPIAEVLLAQRPDVVGLVEADDPATLDRIAWRLGFDFIAAEGAEGRTAALLTRGTIRESINHAALAGSAQTPRSFLETVVEVDEKALRLGVVHTSAKPSEERETLREREMAYVLQAFAPLREAGEPHLLIGDFNANSPIQKIVREHLPQKSRTHFDANGGSIPRRVVQGILDAGYVDTLSVLRPDAAAVMASYTTLEPGQRLDYLFAFGLAPERLKEAWIEQDRLARYASDHFPVGLELAW